MAEHSPRQPWWRRWFGSRSERAAAAPFAVGAYIAAAYWFTSSTSFANPALTVGRTLTDTFAGIDPASAVPDKANRPMYLLDHHEPIRELL